MLSRRCVLTARSLAYGVRSVLAERRTRLRARNIVALRGRRIRRPLGGLPRLRLRVVDAALRIELTRGIAWRARSERLVVIGATRRAGRVILRAGEGTVVSSVAVLERIVVR